MNDRWLLTPQFFENPEPVLGDVVPEGSALNGPHLLADRSPGSMARLHVPIMEFTEHVLRSGDRPVSMAGDCCAAVPVLAGVCASGLMPTLVWIDAHGDFNTPETSPSQFLGGMPLAMMAGRGPQWMCEQLALKPLAEDRIWLIDARDLDPMEREALDASSVRRTGMSGLATLRVDAPVYLHVDLDVLDAAEAPAFNYPVAGGPSVDKAVSACRSFVTANRIEAISFSGWTAGLDEDGRTKAACMRVIEAVVG
ncbi:MAG: arginase family protein [Pseudomonadota bacterium]